MSETLAMKIAVGDEVRVHFHPPGSWKSFFEGVVRRADVTSAEGRFFAVEVTHEVILDREHRIRPGFQDYVRYECRNDFPGRIEILSTTGQIMVREPVPTAPEARESIVQEVDDPLSAELAVSLGPEIEQISGAETNSEEAPVAIESHPANKQGGLLATLFGRKK
ncbi:hypothetical protein ILT44_24980 [Microvirga sp. BT689]|uniref:hypothetical protein n=1 Tax=Microvirga arvi TaxID=2778731 RepID=UPI00194EEB8D|nr:hypothetical protein [Microvirga arvi]MBM6583459.1 hypothetical protein [Microvirga arvi]